jgi:biopolymer transport protein ExbD
VNLKPRRHEEPEINMVSLIDVVLMMVIFFMLSARFNGEGRLEIRLPEAAAAQEPVTRPPAVVVTVTAGGGYLVNHLELVNSSADTLRAAILKVAPTERDVPVSLRADGRATHQSVVTAMDVLGQLGFARLNFVTARAPGAKPP